MNTDRSGERLSGLNEQQAEQDRWLPSKADGDFIEALMSSVVDPGKFAGRIAPPKVGIDNSRTTSSM